MAAPHLSSPRPPTDGYAAAVVTSEQADALFWRRHTQVGLALSTAVVLVVGGYCWLADDVAHRTALAALVAGAALLTVVAALVAPIAIRRDWSGTFFYAWSVASVLVILGGTAADGGDESPIASVLFLPMLFAALAYPFLAVLALGVLEAAGYAIVAAVDPTPSTSYTVVVAATVLAAAVMAATTARTREEQRAQLDAMAVRLRELATHDPLTGCLNRRGFEDALAHELARIGRHGRPVALLLVDVDNLKAVNDDQGHPAGDAALVRAADALARAGRRTDIVARVGGDEFAVLAPETDDGEAGTLAARIHAELRTAGTGAATTVSIGIAATGLAVDLTQLFRVADDALYAAKRAGRDCTRVRRLERRGAVRVPPLPRQSGGDAAVTSRRPVR
jgi:diguanylate cyclase (GGDEF)-like protein